MVSLSKKMKPQAQQGWRTFHMLGTCYRGRVEGKVLSHSAFTWLPWYLLAGEGNCQVHQGRREHSLNCWLLVRLPINPLCQGLTEIPILSWGRMSFPWWPSSAKLRIREHGVRAAFFFRWGHVKYPAVLLFIPSWAPKPASLSLTNFQSSCLVAACIFPWFRVVHSRRKQGKKSLCHLVQTKSPDIPFWKEVSDPAFEN